MAGDGDGGHVPTGVCTALSAVGLRCCSRSGWAGTCLHGAGGTGPKKVLENNSNCSLSLFPSLPGCQRRWSCAWLLAGGQSKRGCLRSRLGTQGACVACCLLSRPPPSQSHQLLQSVNHCSYNNKISILLYGQAIKLACDSRHHGARGFLKAAEQSSAKAAFLCCGALSLPVLQAAQPGRGEDLAPALSAGRGFAACAGGPLTGGRACDAHTFSYCPGQSEVGFSWERRCWLGPNRGAMGSFLVQAALCIPFSIPAGP